MMFSVVIPLYNKEEYIKKTIQSVLNQTYLDFEIIVVNDGSNDNSVNVVKQFDDERVFIVNQVNRGVSAARNRGILIARGNYIAFLDADDEWLPDYLQSIVELINKYPKCGIYTSSYFWNSYGKKRLIEYSISSNDKLFIIENAFKLFIEFNLHTSAVVIPKYIFQDVGNFVTGCHYGEDHELWARISCRYKIAYFNRALSVLNRNDTNSLSQISNNKNNLITSYKQDPIFTKKWLEEKLLTYSYIIVPKEDVCLYINKRRIDICWSLLENGNKDEVFSIIEEIKKSENTNLGLSQNKYNIILILLKLPNWVTLIYSLANKIKFFIKINVKKCLAYYYTSKK